MDFEVTVLSDEDRVRFTIAQEDEADLIRVESFRAASGDGTQRTSCTPEVAAAQLFLFLAGDEHPLSAAMYELVNPWLAEHPEIARLVP